MEIVASLCSHKHIKRLPKSLLKPSSTAENTSWNSLYVVFLNFFLCTKKHIFCFDQVYCELLESYRKVLTCLEAPQKNEKKHNAICRDGRQLKSPMIRRFNVGLLLKNQAVSLRKLLKNRFFQVNELN